LRTVGRAITKRAPAYHRAAGRLFEALLLFANLNEGAIELAHPDLIHANRYNYWVAHLFAGVAKSA
jgi:hypothetical protein